MKILKDDELSPIQKLLFNESSKIADDLISFLDLRIETLWPKTKAISEEISQSDFLTFFGKILELFTTYMILGMKRNIDQCSDHEITHQTIFDDIKRNVAHRLKLHNEIPPLFNNIKRLK